MSRDPRHSNVVTKPSTMSALLARLFEQTTDTALGPSLYVPIVHQCTKHAGGSPSSREVALLATLRW
jgi:hypothetical protein